MVNEEGQLYTIEGIAAAVLIMTTVYLVLNSTMVFTPAETHIYDMQLEQIGIDALAIMDMNTTWDDSLSPYPKSPLETYVENNQADYFMSNFSRYINSKPGGEMDTIQFNATIYYNNDGQVKSEHFVQSRDYNRENAVKVTRWVNVNWKGPEQSAPREQTVLLEVLLWRG